MLDSGNNRFVGGVQKEKPPCTQRTEDSGIIFFPNVKPAEKNEYSAEDNSAIVFMKGKIRYSIDKGKERELSVPSLLLISKNMCFYYTGLTAASFIVVPIRKQDVFNTLSIKDNRNNASGLVDKGFALPMNMEVRKYMELFSDLVLLGMMDAAYLDLKLSELMYIIDKTYSNADKDRFFSVILNEDFFFSNLIRDKYKQARTVKELAGLACYSISGFEKKFRKIFGESASQWLKSQKRIDIYHDLIKSNKTFKEITSEYGFCSTTHFNNYCKTFLGETPGKIRKNSFYSVCN